MNKEKSKKVSESQFTILEEMKNINIPYDNLKPLEPEIDTISMFQKLRQILYDKNSDWTLQIGVINYLRRVQKYDKTVFGQFFYGAKIYPKLLELINSVRSSVSKNVLVLLIEIFSEVVPENKNSIITLVKASLPYVIPKINSNQSFIKAECKQLLESICNHVKFQELLLIILQQMNSTLKIVSTPNPRNKEKDSEILADLFIKSARILGKDIITESTQFPEIIKGLVSFYDLNRNAHGKFCKNILNCLMEIIGRDNFDAKIEKCGKKEKDGLAFIEKVQLDGKTKKMRGTVSSIHFRNHLRERKKSLKLSKCNNSSFDKGNKSATNKIKASGKDVNGAGKKSINLVTLHHNDENVQNNN